MSQPHVKVKLDFVGPTSWSHKGSRRWQLFQETGSSKSQLTFGFRAHFLMNWLNGLLCFLFIPSTISSDLDNCKSKISIYGPGWDDPSLIFSSRYFFVKSPPECASFIQHVSIGPPDGNIRGCLLKKQVLNSSISNTLIVRFRILDSECSNGLKISLLDANQGVVASKEIREPILSEECACDTSDFEERMKCNDNPILYQQLDNDLAHFAKLNASFSQWLSDAVARFGEYPRSYSLCHYQIKSNRLYRTCYGEYVGFSQFFDAIFNSILRKTKLPDTELLVNLGDWPLSSKSQPPIAIFSWCGSSDTFDIVLPTYEMTESVLEMQNRIQVDILSVLGHDSERWQEKETMFFWRGRDSNRIRLLLRQYSKENPQLIDAALTNFFFFRSEDEMNKYGPKVPHVSFFDFFKHKYLVSIDGTVAAYRLPFLLAGSSLLLKQSSKYYEHFYHLLNPGMEFLPLKEDLGDFHQMVSRLTNQSDPNFIPQEEQMQIVARARKLTEQYLLPESIYCYYYRAITKYAQLVPGVSGELGEDVTRADRTCSCDRSKDHVTLLNKHSEL